MPKKKYDSVISFCAPYSERSDYIGIVKYHKIAAYYFLGNKAESDRLLSEVIKKRSYISNLDLLHASVGLKSYFLIEENRNNLINYVLDNYQKENYPQKENGIAIIKFYINDQWIRRNGSFDKYKVDSAYTDEDFAQEADKQDALLLAFYKKNKRLFSPEEVGEDVCKFQNLLLWHISDSKERNNFYLPLMKDAVKKGFFPVQWEVGFILRSELIESEVKGAKAFNMDKRIEELKKEYNLSEYTFFAN